MKKRILAMTLSILLLLGCMAGCGDKSETPQNGNASPDHSSDANGVQMVYHPTYYPIDGGDTYPINYINSYCLCGDTLIFAAEYVVGTETAPVGGEASPYEVAVDDVMVEPAVTDADMAVEETYEYEVYETALFKMDVNTQQVTKLEGYTPAQPPEGQEGSSYISNITPGADNTFWVNEQLSSYYFDLPDDFDPETQNEWDYYMQGENRNSLLQFDAEGNLLKTVDIRMEDDVYVSQLIVDAAGYIYGTDWDSFYLFDSDGKLLATLTSDNYGELVRFSDTQVGVLTWSEDGGRFVQVIDPETKTFGEEIKISDNAWNIMPGSGKYLYIFDNNGTVYGHLAEEDTDEKLFSWLDCDINSSNINYDYKLLEDGRVVAVERNSDDGWPPVNSLVILEKVDASTLPQRQELVLACVNLDWDMRNNILKFNKSQDAVRIVVKDYSEYNTEDDYTAGLTKLNTEILSGNVPDLLATGNLPLERYAAKDLLLDLWTLIDSDAELSREDLMTHFFDVLSIDGKLFQVTSRFSVQTAAGLTAVVGDKIGWDLSELLAALDTLEPGATIFGDYDTKSGILSNCLSRSFDSFIDWSNPAAPCSFESQEFIDMLNFANRFPAEFDWENYDWETAESQTSRLLTGKQLLTSAYLRSFDDLQYAKAQFGGQDVTFVGYPSSEGIGSSFYTYSGLAITAACSDVDAAWSFVRTFLTEEYQTQEYMYYFPTNRHSFEELAKRSMTPEYYTDPETGEQVEQTDTWYIDENTSVEIGALTQAEYDEFMRLYESCNTLQFYDDGIMNIINEEVEPFFAGQSTAEETARLIQNRVTLYVQEQS